jgi:hypothetical protein
MGIEILVIAFVSLNIIALGIYFALIHRYKKLWLKYKKMTDNEE